MPANRVLVCPMDWGLGHATRDAGLINRLLDAGFEVVLGADKAPLYFLRQYFPRLSFIVMPSSSISYPRKGFLMPFKMFILIPKLLIGIYQEHRLLSNILQTNHFDIIISDNRFGLWNKKIYSIFITHQLRILTPKWLKCTEKILMTINRRFINQYDECWIPDDAGDKNLSGKLSHNLRLPLNACYIGMLSRFNPLTVCNNLPVELQMPFDILIILSGPEPQRSIFEKIILSQAHKLIYKCLLIQGRPMHHVFAQSNNLTMVSHLKSAHLSELIIRTPVVISRSGYSTIMDLVRLQKCAILVPTPGQTEQEYLGKYMMDNKWFYCIGQDRFDLGKAVAGFKSFIPAQFPQFEDRLDEKLTNLV